MELCPLHPFTDLEDRDNDVEGSSHWSGKGTRYPV